MSKKQTNKGTSSIASIKSSVWNNPITKYAAGLMILTFLVFGNSMLNDYTYDDKPFISKNYIVQKGFSGIPTLLTTNFWEGYVTASTANPSYRPLPLITLAIEHQIFGLNPLVSHFVNILIYGMTVVLLFFLLNTFFKGKYMWLSLLTAVLFCVHPIHTEVVANIKGRDDLLALFNGLLSIYLIFKYQINKKKTYLVSAVFFFFLGLLSKGHLITFVAIIPLCLYFFSSLSLKKIGMQTIPFAVAAVLFFMIQSQIIGSVTELKTNNIDNPILLASGADAIATKVNVLGLFLQKLTLPHPLSCDYSYAAIQPVTWSYPMIYLWILIYSALIFFAFKGLKTKKLYSFAILFFLITISPISNILIDYVVAFAERAMYTPSLGFVLLLSIIFYHGMEWLKGKKYFTPKITKQISWVGLAILVGGFALKSYSRNSVWKNDLTLFSTDLRTAPESVKLNALYAREVINKFKSQKAVPMNPELEKVKNSIEKIKEITPESIDVPMLFGTLSKITGDYAQAEKYFLEAKGISENATILFNLGVLAGLRKDNQLAKGYFIKSIELAPTYETALFNLGIMYGMENNFAKALEYLERATKVDPTNKKTKSLINDARKKLKQ